MAAVHRLYRNAMAKYPTLISSVQAGALMGAGDAVSQVLIEKRSLKEYEFSRSLRFASLGLFLVGPTLRVWYGVLDRRIGSVGRFAALRKVAVDQLAFNPCFTAVFLTVNGLTQGLELQKVRDNIQRDYVDIMLAAWSVWPAVQVVNFTWVPLRHQVLTVQTFALFWNTYLAWKTNRTREE